MYNKYNMYRDIYYAVNASPESVVHGVFVMWGVCGLAHTYHRNSGKTREERGSKMNKRSKKIVWGTLVLLLMLACSSLTVFAAEDAA